MEIKTYSEMIRLSSFKERFLYLQIGSSVGAITFGNERYLNQILYQSGEWKRVRRQIIIRDNGCDLGCNGYELDSGIIIHHINPITIEDVILRNPKVFDPDNLVCTSHNTHNAIHYGDESLLVIEPCIREQNDTCPWRKKGG